MTENKSISCLNKQECTGCRLCGDSCPKHAITFQEDSEAFFYPVVDDATCINCGLCVKSCPALHADKYGKAKESYAVRAVEDTSVGRRF